MNLFTAFLIVAVIPPTYFPATADSQQIPFNGENRMPSISQYERVSNENETNEISLRSVI